MSFDRETGDLWLGDVGQGSWEEVDVARAGVGGLNFGWVTMEGSHCYRAETCNRDGLTLPASDYGRDQGCTVIGGYVYRGETYEFLRGTYLFADYCSGNLFAIDASADDFTTPDGRRERLDLDLRLRRGHRRRALHPRPGRHDLEGRRDRAVTGPSGQLRAVSCPAAPSARVVTGTDGRIGRR